MRRNHRYQWWIVPHPDPIHAAEGIGQPVEICRKCGVVRETIGTVGLFRRIRSYIRPDGIRFTGQAPVCGGQI